MPMCPARPVILYKRSRASTGVYTNQQVDLPAARARILCKHNTKNTENVRLITLQPKCEINHILEQNTRQINK